MRSFIVTFTEEGKIRSRQVVAPDPVAARLHVSTQLGGIILRVAEECDGCGGLILDEYESPLNGDDRYCEMCTAMDAFVQADLPAIVVKEEAR